MRRPGSFSGPEKAIEFVPEDLERPLDFAELFSDPAAPLEVDLGCGDGLFLAARAAENPTRNFLGIERMIGRVRTSCRRITRHQATNARVIRIEIEHAVRTMLPRESVDVFYLLFPDPWPKRRHQPRRVFTPELLITIAGALKPNGLFQVATDQHDYFTSIMRIACEAAALRVIDDTELADLPSTTFGQRFTEAGQEIYRLALRKVSP